MRKELVVLIIVVTAMTWLTMAAIFGLPTTWLSAIRPFASAITVAGITLWGFDRFIWHWAIFRGRLTYVPDLRGVWRVTINSTWIDPATNEPVKPIQAFAQIDQTASTFCLRTFTPESRSQTTAFSFTLDQGVFKIAIVYENKPDINLRETRSAFHQGSATFNARGFKPKSFSGEYWTERKSIGSITLSDRKKGEIDSYADGQALFADKSDSS
ncbi:MAG: hypothetical protein P8P99_07255 [Maricaulis sp.]|nr:hypothetical protein [Maricaulis sp.]